jgi:lipopolysaccharide biosynthesis protein
MKRIAFYLFYDEHGIVDDYIVYKLKKLKEHVEHVVFVVNGLLTSESRDKIKPVTDTIFCRENIGFDVWGYKEGIELIGFDELEKYDELILLNYTFFGPLYPFKELFDWSENQKVDFWGISDHDELPEPNFVGHTLPRHIQSHFIAVRRTMFLSPEFKLYWSNMPMIHTYVDSILNHESKFTKYFSDKGYQSLVYIDVSNYESSYPIATEFKEALLNRCPILKRRIFFQTPLIDDSLFTDVDEYIHTIKDLSSYDVNLIYSNILRTTKPKDLATNLTLLKVFDSQGDISLLAQQKIAVLAHIYYPDMFLEIVSYTENIPQDYDLYITTASVESQNILEDFILEWKKTSKFCQYTEVRVVEKNRGRDMSALFISMQDIVLERNYDLLCRIHSKKTPQVDKSRGEGFKKYMFENVLSSPTYVSKVLNLMNSEENIGLAMPSMIHIGFPTLGHSWFTNKEGTKNWCKKLNISIPLDDFTPHAAYGTVYWFKPKALAPIFAYPFKWEDFNEEPHHVDGSLAHILERILAYVAHSQGYIAMNIMCANMMQKSYVKLEYKASKILSYLPNGDMHYQCYLLSQYSSNQAIGSIDVFDVSLKQSIKNTIKALARSIDYRFPQLAKILKPFYRVAVKTYRRFK